MQNKKIIISVSHTDDTGKFWAIYKYLKKRLTNLAN